MTNTYWKVVFGAIAAVCAFLLVQTDLELEPIVRVVIGAITVALAAINPNRAEG